MSTKIAEFNNSYVTIHNREIDIHYRNKNVKIAIEKVAKIYIAKKKSKFRSRFGLHLFFNSDYNLCIKTRDGNDIFLGVKASERQSFVNLIAFVRRQEAVWDIDDMACLLIFE